MGGMKWGRQFGGIRIRALIACVCFLSFSAWAVQPCFSFASLAFGSGETLGSDKVIETYVRLLKEVGGLELTPEVVAKIVAGGDPLAIPKDVYLTGELERSLDQFKRLLDVHFEGNFPYRAELLKALSTIHEKQQVAKQEVDRAVAKNGVAFEVKTMDRYMPEHMGRHGEWIMGVGPTYSARIAGKKGGWIEPNSVYLVDGDWKLHEVPYETPEGTEGVIVVENNPATGEIFFSDRNNGFPFWKITALDEHGKPLKQAKVERLQIDLDKDLEGGSIDNLAFTPDGKVAIGIDDRNGAYAFPLTGAGPKGIKPVALGPVQTGGDEVNFGPVGNAHFFLRKGKDLTVVPVSGTGGKISIKLKDGYEEAFGSPDGKTLYVHYRTLGEKPKFVAYDLDALAVNPRTPPKIFDAGHPKELGEWTDPVRDQLFFPPNSPYVIQSYMGQWRHGDPKRQLRVIDPKTFKVMGTFDLPATPVGQIQKLHLSPDGTKILGHQDRGDFNGSNAVVYQVDVAAVLGRVSEP